MKRLDDLFFPAQTLSDEFLLKVQGMPGHLQTFGINVNGRAVRTIQSQNALTPEDYGLNKGSISRLIFVVSLPAYIEQAEDSKFRVGTPISRCLGTMSDRRVESDGRGLARF